MQNALDICKQMDKQALLCKDKAIEHDAFKLMVELAELQVLVREAMRFALDAQNIRYNEIQEEAQRIP